MTAETYLRRALLAPIIVPLLAAASFLFADQSSRQDGGTSEIANYVKMFLLCSLIVGGIPYLWMLHAKRDDLRRLTGGCLKAALQALPFEMLPYFWKFWGVLTALLLLTFYGFFAGAMILFIGTFAVPILGFIYISITFAFLRGFQGLGLVEKSQRRF